MFIKKSLQIIMNEYQGKENMGIYVFFSFMTNRYKWKQVEEEYSVITSLPVAMSKDLD